VWVSETGETCFPTHELAESALLDAVLDEIEKVERVERLERVEKESKR